jgi:hypothetical protein
MRIQLTKRPDGGAVLRCERDDGSTDWQRHEGEQAAFFPRHDLTHYALETVLRCSEGFFGLVAAGWPIADTTGKGARGSLPPAAIVIEHLVGFLEVEGATHATWSAADFAEQLRAATPEAAAAAAIEFTPDHLREVRTRREELLALWTLTVPGETMELWFEPSVPAT